MTLISPLEHSSVASITFFFKFTIHIFSYIKTKSIFKNETIALQFKILHVPHIGVLHVTSL